MLNPMSLTGKIVLVTGASSGIGRETSILLSKLGARIILSGRSISNLYDTKKELEGEGHFVEPFDLLEASKIPAWLKNISEKTGAIAGMAHCAGIQNMKPINILNKQDIDSVIGANLISSIMLISGYKQRGVFTKEGGSIVLMSSVMGIVGQAARSLYSASKAGMIGLTKSAALELARSHIRVNCVAPGYVVTNMSLEVKNILSREQYERIEAMHPLGIGTALDVAYVVAFLLSDCTSWITGSTIVVDGGYTAQ